MITSQPQSTYIPSNGYRANDYYNRNYDLTSKNTISTTESSSNINSNVEIKLANSNPQIIQPAGSYSNKIRVLGSGSRTGSNIQM